MKQVISLGGMGDGGGWSGGSACLKQRGWEIWGEGRFHRYRHVQGMKQARLLWEKENGGWSRGSASLPERRSENLGGEKFIARCLSKS